MQVYFIDHGTNQLLHFVTEGSRADYVVGDHVGINKEMHGRKVEIAGIIVAVRHNIADVSPTETTHSLAVHLETY